MDLEMYREERCEVEAKEIVDVVELSRQTHGERRPARVKISRSLDELEYGERFTSRALVLPTRKSYSASPFSCSERLVGTVLWMMICL